MSSQLVIQDSDDDSGDDCSIDPLQDPSPLYAPSASDDRASPAEHGTELIPTSIPESNLPQVDFDMYLRPESSIMAGDYEDERWVATADAAPTGAPQPYLEYNYQRHDDTFLYAAKTPSYAVPDPLPLTASMGRSEPQQAGNVETTDEYEQPSKRRKISLTQDILQEPSSIDKSELGVSYNFFASIDPHAPSQVAATELRASVDLPHQTQEADSPEFVPERFETPPPTVPLSEDLLYDQDRAENEPPPTTIHESTFETPGGQGFEMDNEALGSKKKRGRPKKQALANKTEDEVEFVSDNMIDQIDHTSKKKLGRPKKKDRDTSPDELAMDEMMKHQADDAREQKAVPKSEKPKKKVKRSKTTSDLPNTTGLPNADRDVRWIDNSLAIDLENTESKPSNVDEAAVVSVSKEETPMNATGDDKSATKDTKAEPKKRGRKKKPTTEGPPAAYVESSTVLQDISNTAHLSTKDEQDPNDAQVEDTKSMEVNETERPQKEVEAAVSLAEAPMKSETTPAKPEGEDPASMKQVPAKPSPIPNISKVPYRVGLSRRARIAPLLKIVRK
ncbi:hypothetical protein PISL3812_01232 [Talaromyces islandicus]|uniref:Uncharacterized protein n=1 Tax=Talaromyces islandicus TaxID=28573 RepID=A0A0U1LN91_TALIS|nr:hypothetical protein PISL3812_01232 [Talaromyces islandicus]